MSLRVLSYLVYVLSLLVLLSMPSFEEWMDRRHRRPEYRLHCSSIKNSWKKRIITTNKYRIEVFDSESQIDCCRWFSDSPFGRRDQNYVLDSGQTNFSGHLSANRLILVRVIRVIISAIYSVIKLFFIRLMVCRQTCWDQFWTTLNHQLSHLFANKTFVSSFVCKQKTCDNRQNQQKSLRMIYRVNRLLASNPLIKSLVRQLSVEQNVSQNFGSDSELTFSHRPVMCHQIMRALRPEDGQVFIDMTFGGGGHSKQLLATNKKITIYRGSIRKV